MTDILYGKRIINGTDDLEQNPFGVQNCARCEGNHSDLIVHRFAISDYSDGLWFHWWAECPTTGDPILIALVESDGTTKSRGELWP